jgi:acyl carrier protein
MCADEIRRKLKESIARITGIGIDDISEDQSYRDDLGLDSLSMLELAVDAEYEFGVKISDEQLAEITTIADTIKIIADHLAVSVS